VSAYRFAGHRPNSGLQECESGIQTLTSEARSACIYGNFIVRCGQVSGIGGLRERFASAVTAVNLRRTKVIRTWASGEGPAYFCMRQPSGCRTDLVYFRDLWSMQKKTEDTGCGGMKKTDLYVDSLMKE
jgi:hypothetical protein